MDHSGSGLKWAAAMLFAGFSALAYAQPATNDAPREKTDHGRSTETPAPTAEALPSGDPKTGVLTPPNVDPKMAKTVPDVDPGMSNRSPGKTPEPSDPANPRIQPR